MKKILLTLFLLLIPSISYADSYVIENDDGTIFLFSRSENTKEQLSVSLEKAGLTGKPHHAYDFSQLPPTEDSDFWEWKNNKVEVNQTKKQAHLDKIAEKKAKQDAVLSKLKISKDEWKELNDKDVPITNVD